MFQKHQPQHRCTEQANHGLVPPGIIECNVPQVKSIPSGNKMAAVANYMGYTKENVTQQNFIKAVENGL